MIAVSVEIEAGQAISELDMLRESNGCKSPDLYFFRSVLNPHFHGKFA
jgi:hypothetical protein